MVKSFPGEVDGHIFNMQKDWHMLTDTEGYKMVQWIGYGYVNYWPKKGCRRLDYIVHNHMEFRMSELAKV